VRDVEADGGRINRPVVATLIHMSDLPHQNSNEVESGDGGASEKFTEFVNIVGAGVADDNVS
jgi:hypothetical protein